ncbi:MAG: DNA polymerase III subunit delta [Salinarimonas sp.]
MVALKPQDAERTLTRLAPEVRLVLIYGPDSGLVAERARKLAESSVSDAEDPFLLVKLDGDLVASDPARMADEVATIGMFGGRRVVWVRPGSKNLAGIAEIALDSEGGDTLVIIEAGDLQKSSPLRTLCEKSKRALAVPCYLDEGRDLASLVDEAFRNAGIGVSRETRQILIESLGGNRLASRAEIEKLLLYLDGKSRVEPEDIEAILSNVADFKADMLVDAAYAGRLHEADALFRRLLAEGGAITPLLSALIRHGLALIPQAEAVSRGQSPAMVAENWRSLFFKRRASAKQQLQLWDPDRLRSVVERLQRTVLETRRNPALHEALASRAVLDIARTAKRFHR